MPRHLAICAALLAAACEPIVEAGADAPELGAPLIPGEGLPPRGQPACAPPGQSAGIEPPCAPAAGEA